MQKRGQITIFIIVGIIVLAIFLGMIFINQLLIKEKIIVEEEVVLEPIKIAPVKLFIEECLEQTSRDAILIVSSQGGYYQTPEPFYSFAYLNIPYYFDLGYKNIPSKNLIEQQISQYTNEFIHLCLRNLPEMFKEYQLSYGILGVETSIGEESVIVNLNMPTTIFIGNKITTISNFQVNIRSELNQALGLTESIIEKQEENPNYVRMSYLSKLSLENDLFIELVHEDNTVFYKLRFPDSKFNDDWYVFIFAIKYDWP